MEYLLIAALVVGLMLIANKKKDKKPKPQPVPVPVVEPEQKVFPKGAYIYIDDMTPSLTSDQGGDFNAPQDLATVLAIAEKFNSWPEAIGINQVRGKIGKQAAQSIVDAAGLDIPILSGATSDNGGESELSKWLVARSKKGCLLYTSPSPRD